MDFGKEWNLTLRVLTITLNIKQGNTVRGAKWGGFLVEVAFALGLEGQT